MRSTVTVVHISKYFHYSDRWAHSWYAGPACAEHAGNCSVFLSNNKSKQVWPVLYAKRGKTCVVGPIKFKRFHRR